MSKARIFWGICAVITMAAIFAFSSQTYNETMKTSDVIVKPIENAVRKDSSMFESEKEEKDYIKKLENRLDLAVRKSAHMCIFGVLAICVYMFCKSMGMNDADAIIMTLVVCGLYGGIDELHQRFIEKRHSKFTDVCVDEFGSVIALTITRAANKIKSRRANVLQK